MILKSLTIKTKVKGLKKLCLLALAGVALTACSAMQNADENPVFRKFQWFSYLQGDDFKANCAGSDRYRLVYNGVYTEQVRIYDITRDDLNLHTRVVLPVKIKKFEVDSFSGLLNPWRGEFKDITLKASDIDGLVQDLQNLDVFGASNVGAELSSKGFFWTIAACHGGQYHFTGFAWPSENWPNFAFADRLFDLDPLGIDVNPPRKTRTTRLLSNRKGRLPDEGKEFHLKVGDNKLVGLGTLF